MNVLFSFAVMYGITYGLMYAKLFNRLRDWLANKYVFFYQLISCPWCTGFHSGWLTYLLITPLHNWAVLACIAYAFAGTAVSGVLDTLINFLEIKKPS